MTQWLIEANGNHTYVSPSKVKEIPLKIFSFPFRRPSTSFVTFMGNYSQHLLLLKLFFYLHLKFMEIDLQKKYNSGKKGNFIVIVDTRYVDFVISQLPISNIFPDRYSLFKFNVNNKQFNHFKHSLYLTDSSLKYFFRTKCSTHRFR